MVLWPVWTQAGSVLDGENFQNLGSDWLENLCYNSDHKNSDILFSIETEVWELENGNNKIVDPTLANHYKGLALYAVDFSFCSI